MSSEDVNKALENLANTLSEVKNNVITTEQYSDYTIDTKVEPHVRVKDPVTYGAIAKDKDGNVVGKSTGYKSENGAIEHCKDSVEKDGELQSNPDTKGGSCVVM